MSFVQEVFSRLRARRAPQLVPAPRSLRGHIHLGAAVRYRTEIVNPDGSTAKRRSWKKNLILDQGLNKIGNAVGWAKAFQYACVGTGVPTLRRDSNPVTFTQTANVITASAGFFLSTDVGRLFKWGTGTGGTEVYITAYTSATQVTVSTSPDVGVASVGTVWYVNLTGLVSESKRTNNYTAAGGDNGSSFASATLSMWRTFLFSAETGSVTYTEIGWSDASGAGANLFGMDLIPGAGDSLTAGQQYKVKVELQITFSPSTATAVGDVGNNGFVTAGNHMVTSCASAAHCINHVNSDGSTENQATILDFSDTGMWLATATFNLPANTQSAFYSVPSQVASDGGTNWSAYTSATFRRDLTRTWSTGIANGSIYGLGVADGGFDAPWALKFTAAQTKDNIHTVTAVFRLSWNRILTN